MNLTNQADSSPSFIARDLAWNDLFGSDAEIVENNVGESVGDIGEQFAEFFVRHREFIIEFIRHRGLGFHDAEDLAQSFFFRLSKEKRLKRLLPIYEKHRPALTEKLRIFLESRESKRILQIGCEWIPFEQVPKEERNASPFLDPAATIPALDRDWAFLLSNEVLNKIESEYDATGSSKMYHVLKQAILEEPERKFDAKSAAALRKSELCVRVGLHRLRRRFGKLLRSEIKKKMPHMITMKEEIRQVVGALTIAR